MNLRDHLILYVDDEHPNRVVFDITFGKEFKIKSVSSAEEALAFVSQENVAVIVTDQRMTGMSGDELLKKVKDVSPDTVRRPRRPVCDQALGPRRARRDAPMGGRGVRRRQTKQRAPAPPDADRAPSHPGPGVRCRPPRPQSARDGDLDGRRAAPRSLRDRADAATSLARGRHALAERARHARTARRGPSRARDQPRELRKLHERSHEADEAVPAPRFRTSHERKRRARSRDQARAGDVPGRKHVLRQPARLRGAAGPPTRTGDVHGPDADLREPGTRSRKVR